MIFNNLIMKAIKIFVFIQILHIQLKLHPTQNPPQHPPRHHFIFRFHKQLGDSCSSFNVSILGSVGHLEYFILFIWLSRETRGRFLRFQTQEPSPCHYFIIIVYFQFHATEMPPLLNILLIRDNAGPTGSPLSRQPPSTRLPQCRQ